MKTVKEMIQALGTVAYVALSLRVSQRTMYLWIANNEIGRAHRLNVYNMLRDAGYTEVTLKQINELQPTKKEAAKC